MSALSVLQTIARQQWAIYPGGIIVLGIALVLFILFTIFMLIVYFLAPNPRPPFTSEIIYKTVLSDGSITEKRLPCWQDKWLKDKVARKAAVVSEKESEKKEVDEEVEPAEVLLSVVVPAYNEQDRLGGMLEEAIEVLNNEYSTSKLKDSAAVRKRNVAGHANGSTSASSNSSSNDPTSGWEILIVSDGSEDNTVQTALSYAKKHPDGAIRVISLKHNRGKGGAVTHGMRHARGVYVMFADADGASKFSDVGKLISACKDAALRDNSRHGRAVAVGSRAHLVGSDVVVKRSPLRNFLMHGFHLFLWLLTPPATSKIQDTQCGFKLFSRPALPYIVPHMHSEGWIFDVEMLMLAERAGIPMVEVPVGWHEVKGSKLNVLWDSLGMAWGLGILRLAWAMGVYQT